MMIGSGSIVTPFGLVGCKCPLERLVLGASAELFGSSRMGGLGLQHDSAYGLTDININDFHEDVD